MFNLSASAFGISFIKRSGKFRFLFLAILFCQIAFTQNSEEINLFYQYKITETIKSISIYPPAKHHFNTKAASTIKSTDKKLPARFEKDRISIDIDNNSSSKSETKIDFKVFICDDKNKNE